MIRINRPINSTFRALVLVGPKIVYEPEVVDKLEAEVEESEMKEPLIETLVDFLAYAIMVLVPFSIAMKASLSLRSLDVFDHCQSTHAAKCSSFCVYHE